ncbi:ABC transporter permease [Streptomyces litchfieldiae]|uniref:ABC transporter permease n=1 Tax=Streptomyces litchfieldiae TaxID=3075543 RepID=A0ABU2MSD9_9ACTN|nr:ABC transporter permease [Streptomyces sp. DSM 44938]MDT0344540.1 ABC transporter permease [Streptomyces sp. DSM 44938]
MEWTKLRTLPSTWWLLLALVGTTVAVGVATAASLSAGDCPAPAHCDEDTVKLSLTGVWAGQGAVLVLAVLSMSGEYGAGTIGTTLRAEPGRTRVLAAKALVVCGLTVATGAAGVAGSLLAGRALLTAEGFPVPALGDESLLRAAGGTVLYLALAALIGLGAAAALRDTATATTAVLVLFYAFPLLAGLLADPDWQETAQRVAPATAGFAIQSTIELDRLPIGPWAGLGVVGVWAAGALLAGGTMLRLRDA